MTGAQTIAAFRRALVPAIVVGIAVLGLVVGVLLSRSPSYQARVSVYAKPVSTNQAVANDFGAIVTMNMQALPELAVSDGTIQAIRAAVPGVDADALRNNITVELVPASGVARITVRTASSGTATAALQALLGQVEKADLLNPVATLQTTGRQDLRAELVERDPSLAVGLGLVGAVVASLFTVVLVQSLRPRLLTAQDVERVVDDVFEEAHDAPAVVDLRDHASGLNLLAAHLLAQNPLVSEVTVIPTGPAWRGDLARQLRNALRNLRVAREVGVALNPLAGPPGRNGSARTGGDELGGPPEPSRRGGLFSGPVSSTTLQRSAAAAVTASAAALAEQQDAEARAQDGRGASHLVVTVRLGRTTPVALQTALIALRTHGTGVAGVAVG